MTGAAGKNTTKHTSLLKLVSAHYVNITLYGITTVRGPVVTELTLTMKMLAIDDRAATKVKPTSAAMSLALQPYVLLNLCVIMTSDVV